MTNPFALKFYSLIQNNIGGNIDDGLNSVTCEQPLKESTVQVTMADGFRCTLVASFAFTVNGKPLAKGMS